MDQRRWSLRQPSSLSAGSAISQQDRSHENNARGLRPLFGGVIFLGSFLLFLVEPLAAKQLVPLFGGSAAVWLTCLVFFQTALLAGYLYAHWFGQVPAVTENTRARGAWSRWLHPALLLMAAVCTVAWAVGWPGSGGLSPAMAEHPVAIIFERLSISIGLPFLLLASTSPLLQVWFARTTRGGMPYRLFALSNLASLLALALYPTLIEPHVTLHHQRFAWCVGFIAFAALAAFLQRRVATASPAEADPVKDAASLLKQSLRPDNSVKVLWLLLPMCAGMQLSAVTSHLTENIAAIPLLWVLPLAVYLLSLIVAFEYPRLVPTSITVRLLAVLLASLGYMLSRFDTALPIKISVPFYLLELFVACLFLHSAAYAARPRQADGLTGFYLLFAAGGALGSFLIGIACPLLFSANYDLAISFVATALLTLVVTWQSGWAQRLMWSASSALLLYLVVLLHGGFEQNRLVGIRNFYGSLRVEQKNMGTLGIMRSLTNGTIKHGTQIFSPALSRTPTTYYAQDSGIGLAVRFCCAHRCRRIGVIGLGVGTIAAYGRAGDTLRFYEINPSVLPVAQNLFTYLRDTPARVYVVEGDARASLAAEPSQQFDVLAIDAFSGDSIPLHLLTKEAMDLYQRHLAPGGILAFHVSNQYVDLEPQIGLLARQAGMQARTVLTAADADSGEFAAEWVLVTNNAAFLQNRNVILRLNRTEERTNVRLWTDDYSSLLPVLHW
jgi:SAM-dependent methyltransferase